MDGFRQARGSEDLQTIAATHAVAQLRIGQQKLSEAEEMLLQLIDSYKRLKSPDKTGLLEVINTLGVVYEAQQKSELAEQLLKPALQESAKELGTDHPTTLMIKSNLAMPFRSQGKNFEAEQYPHRSIGGKTSSAGRSTP